jgi:phage gpG-like protein
LALEIKVQTDLGAARQAFAYLRNLGEDPRPLLEIAGQIAESNWRDRFRTGRGPGGVPWPISQRVTHAAQPKRGRIGPSQGGRTLFNKGGLVGSLTHEVRGKSAKIGIIPKTKSARFGYVHQFGATILPRRGEFLIFTAPDGHKVFARKVTIPARPFIGFDDQDRADIHEAWMDHVRSLLQ